VSYASPDDERYVAIVGVVRVTHDPAKAEQLWSPATRDWFPDGPTDTNLALLAVKIRHAEYCDAEEYRMKQFFNKAKAVLTGEQPPHVSVHKEMEMS
jgi:general stress protein 26